MNFCTKCASYYQVAGTCNCFATTVPVVHPEQPVVPFPWDLLPPYPWHPTYPGTWPGNITWGIKY